MLTKEPDGPSLPLLHPPDASRVMILPFTLLHVSRAMILPFTLLHGALVLYSQDTYRSRRVWVNLLCRMGFDAW